MGIAAGMKDIVQDIVSSRDARVTEVKGLKEEANKMLGSFKASHKKMGAQLRRELAQSRSSLESEVEELLKDAQDLVRGFAKSREEAGKTLRKGLARGRADRESQVHVMLNDFQRAHNQMGTQFRKELADYDRGIKSEVAGMRQETKADLGEARTAWQELTRGIRKATAEAAPESVKGKAKEAPAADEEGPDLEAKLLAAIREHPQGITLTEVAQSLGVAPIVLGRAARKVVNEGRVRKENKTYFPIARE